MKKWEYKISSLASKDKDSEIQLSQLGRVGWEAVGLTILAMLGIMDRPQSRNFFVFNLVHCFGMPNVFTTATMN